MSWFFIGIIIISSIAMYNKEERRAKEKKEDKEKETLFATPLSKQK